MNVPESPTRWNNRGNDSGMKRSHHPTLFDVEWEKNVGEKKVTGET